MRKLFVALVLAALLGGIALRIYQKVAAERKGSPVRGRKAAAVAVRTQPVRRAAIRDVRVFTGTLAPAAQFVVAPKIAGRLEKLLVNVGEEVSSGQVIALLDSAEYAQNVEQARAELDVARANVVSCQSDLDLATREVARVRELRKAQVASEAELDRAETQYRAAQARYEVALAQVKQREAALKAEEVRLSYTRIVATWEGGSARRVIGERFVDEGAMLRANEAIVTVLDTETLLAIIAVAERDYPSIRIGQTAAIKADAVPGSIFTGRVVRKAPLLKESSRAARVEIEVPNPERVLAPGMFVRAELEFDRRDNAMVVPAAAVVRRNGRTGVFLANPAVKKAVFVPVVTGIVSGDGIEILAPPLEGEVVTLGQHLLDDGSAILVQNPETNATQSASGPPVGPGTEREKGPRSR